MNTGSGFPMKSIKKWPLPPGMIQISSPGQGLSIGIKINVNGADWTVVNSNSRPYQDH